jgi:hypothetical protein
VPEHGELSYTQAEELVTALATRDDGDLLSVRTPMDHKLAYYVPWFNGGRGSIPVQMRGFKSLYPRGLITDDVRFLSALAMHFVSSTLLADLSKLPHVCRLSLAI